jgi:hypothetical protein
LQNLVVGRIARLAMLRIDFGDPYQPQQGFELCRWVLLAERPVGPGRRRLMFDGRACGPAPAKRIARSGTGWKRSTVIKTRKRWPKRGPT